MSWGRKKKIRQNGLRNKHKDNKRTNKNRHLFVFCKIVQTIKIYWVKQAFGKSNGLVVISIKLNTTTATQ